MPNLARAEKLLSLFASPDRAAAIAGDLAEERRDQGAIRFWVDVLRTTLALGRNLLADAPLAAPLLVLAGFVMFTVPALVGYASVMYFPLRVSHPETWIAPSLIWWGGALWTGASLVWIAPKRGMIACALLAGIYEALSIAGLWLVHHRNPEESQTVRAFLTIGLVIAGPLLAGGALARWRAMTGAKRTAAN